METAATGSSVPRSDSGAYDIDSALRAAANRLAAAARWDPRRKADKSEWSTWQVLAHLAAATEGYTEYANGRRTPIADVSNLPTESLRMIEEVGEAEPGALVSRVQTAVDAFIEAAGGLQDGELFFWHGMEVPVQAAKGILLGELLVHGLDLARSHGEAWPISAAEAVAVIEGVMAVAPAFVSPAAKGLTATIRLKLRKGARWILRFDNGRLSVEPDTKCNVDWTISADPVAFLLLSYGRDKQFRHLVSGRVAAWGKRPLIGLRFDTYIAKP
jgi:uncharacterized protein (TIGR03083 family)